jgi:hypothetical protein
MPRRPREFHDGLYHLILQTPDARISLAFQQFHTAYARHHNRVHGRSAHLFRAHFLAREITSDEQLLTAARYLALNPVLAGLAPHPLAWRWSSTRSHAGLQNPSIPLDQTPLRAAFDDDLQWQQRYCSYIEAATSSP